jgi:phytoene desaturase
MPKSAIVIGAGLGGLAAASLLAVRGFNVKVYEKNMAPGGKMQQVTAQGYRFDTGPSLFTMPFILKNLFEECGKSMDDYLAITEPEPLCRYFYPDKVIFDNYADRNRSMNEIKKFAPEDAEAYSSFLDRSEDLYSRTSEAFLFNPLYGFRDLKHLNLLDFLDIDAFSTVSDKVDQYVKSDYLRKFFKRFTTYNGSSPYHAPATLNVIPHVELNQGGYYVLGGLYKIAETMHLLAAELGVKFHFETEVESIEHSGKKATAVTLKSGKTVSCDLLIANSDATDTIINLLPESVVNDRKKEKQKAIEPSCSGFVMMLGCNKKWESLRHHNIFFSDNYRKEFDDIFDAKKMPSDPTIYIANTSFTELGHAPAGGANLFVLVNAPYISEGQDWESVRTQYSAFLIQELEKRGLEGLGNSIEYFEVITPPDFLNRYGSNRGSIYGTSSNSKFAAFMRPRNKLRGIENLYLVGGSTHPGGGIPLVIQSAFNAMELLERENAE